MFDFVIEVLTMFGYERISGSMLSLLAGSVLIGCSMTGQNTDIANQGDPGAVPDQDAQIYGEIPADTRFDVQLQQTLGTEASEPGDRWTGVVTGDVTDGDRVLLQRGSVVSGVVTRAGPVEVEGETRQMLAIQPEELEVGGEAYAIDAEVVKAEARENKDLLTGENAAIVGGGALAGTLLGEILLDDALLGAILGAAGGTAIAVSRSDTEIELKEGSILTLELERAVRPRASSYTSSRGS